MNYKYEDFKGENINTLIGALLEDGYSLKVEPQDDDFIGRITAYENHKPQTFENCVLEAEFEDGVISFVMSSIEEEKEEKPFPYTALEWDIYLHLI